jgi:hypothetical protein
VTHSAPAALDHLRELVHLGPVRTADVHPEAGGLSQRLAVGITTRVGTMTCAGVFSVIALVSLPAAIATGNVIVIVSWVAQTYLQLVLLSIVLLGTNVQAAHADARAEVDHQVLAHTTEILASLHAMQETQMPILERLDASRAAPTPE